MKSLFKTLIFIAVCLFPVIWNTPEMYAAYYFETTVNYWQRNIFHHTSCEENPDSCKDIDAFRIPMMGPQVYLLKKSPDEEISGKYLVYRNDGFLLKDGSFSMTANMDALFLDCFGKEKDELLYYQRGWVKLLWSQENSSEPDLQVYNLIEQKHKKYWGEQGVESWGNLKSDPPSAPLELPVFVPGIVLKDATEYKDREDSYLSITNTGDAAIGFELHLFINPAGQQSENFELDADNLYIEPGDSLLFSILDVLREHEIGIMQDQKYIGYVEITGPGGSKLNISAFTAVGGLAQDGYVEFRNLYYSRCQRGIPIPDGIKNSYEIPIFLKNTDVPEQPQMKDSCRMILSNPGSNPITVTISSIAADKENVDVTIQANSSDEWTPSQQFEGRLELSSTNNFYAYIYDERTAPDPNSDQDQIGSTWFENDLILNPGETKNTIWFSLSKPDNSIVSDTEFIFNNYSSSDLCIVTLTAQDSIWSDKCASDGELGTTVVNVHVPPGQITHFFLGKSQNLEPNQWHGGSVSFSANWSTSKTDDPSDHRLGYQVMGICFDKTIADIEPDGDYNADLSLANLGYETRALYCDLKSPQIKLRLRKSGNFIDASWTSDGDYFDVEIKSPGTNSVFRMVRRKFTGKEIKLFAAKEGNYIVRITAYNKFPEIQNQRHITSSFDFQYPRKKYEFISRIPSGSSRKYRVLLPAFRPSFPKQTVVYLKENSTNKMYHSYGYLSADEICDHLNDYYAYLYQFAQQQEVSFRTVWKIMENDLKTVISNQSLEYLGQMYEGICAANNGNVPEISAINPDTDEMDSRPLQMDDLLLLNLLDYIFRDWHDTWYPDSYLQKNNPFGFSGTDNQVTRHRHNEKCYLMNVFCQIDELPDNLVAANAWIWLDTTADNFILYVFDFSDCSQYPASPHNYVMATAAGFIYPAGLGLNDQNVMVSAVQSSTPRFSILDSQEIIDNCDALSLTPDLNLDRYRLMLEQCHSVQETKVIEMDAQSFNLNTKTFQIVGNPGSPKDPTHYLTDHLGFAYQDTSQNLNIINDFSIHSYSDIFEFGSSGLNQLVCSNGYLNLFGLCAMEKIENDVHYYYESAEQHGMNLCQFYQLLKPAESNQKFNILSQTTGLCSTTLETAIFLYDSSNNPGSGYPYNPVFYLGIPRQNNDLYESGLTPETIIRYSWQELFSLQ